jgi:hypothetical protein
MKQITTNLLRLLCLCLPFLSFAQSTTSGQAKFITPSILSSCNRDTICIELMNSQGAKNTTYTGNITLEIDIPGDTLVEYIAGSLSSVPTGATQVSYVNKKLIISVPLPALGSTTKVCFVVRPDCNVPSMPNLPNFLGKITYPPGFPTPAETFQSGDLNTGAAIFNHALYDLTTFGNPTPAFGAEFRVITNLTNGGYGNVNEFYYYTINANALNTYPAVYFYVISASGVYHYPTPAYVAPISSVPYNATHTLNTYKFTGANLGPDNLFTSGETIRVDQYLYAPNMCADYDLKRWASFSCGTNKPLCQLPDTLYSHVKVAAGTPKIDGTLVSAEDMDGCPNKKIIFNYTNTGTGNAMPTGNAYDINLGINFGGGLITINNLKLNSVVIPLANITPNAAASSFTIKLKDLMTTDPDGAGGISDIDGDGFYDDMLVAATTQVEFDYTIPCDLACGANLFYQLGASATYTDFCRTLVGSSSTPLKEFGFQQVQPIEQTKMVDYGTLTTGQFKSDTAKYNFQYKQYNLDLSAAVGELHIRYQEHMEINLGSIKINGVVPTNAPVLYGDNSTGALPDNDSMAVVILTAAELATLFDPTGDKLEYEQTYYGCDTRQNSKTGDNWQLLVRLKAGLCGDGSTPCGFDLACKKPFVYTFNTGCGTKPCYVQSTNFKRLKAIGFTDVTEGTPSSLIDANRTYEGDTVQFTVNSFINGFSNQKANGYHTNIGQPHLDFRSVFAFKYTTPKTWNGNTNPWIFLPTTSTVCIRQRTYDPLNPSQPGTIGAVLFEAPILIEDFGADGGSMNANNQTSYGQSLYIYPPSTNGSPAWYCANSPTSWHISGLCPIVDGFWYDPAYRNIAYGRYRSLDKTKAGDNYYLNVGKALARAGWTGNTGDPNIYIEVKTRWRMDESFPWDNSNSYTMNGYSEHLGDYLSYPTSYSSNPASTYNGSCGEFATTGLTVTKEHFISNPNAVYSASCGLRASNKVFFKSYEGNYFDNSTGEVRVPLKIDSIVIDLPTEYQITPGTIKLKYQQSCAELTDAVNITGSAATGHVVFTNTGLGGDFPRADDCSGNKVAYDLCYDLVKVGGSAPTLYRFPIKIYTRDEFGKITIMRDSASISEDKPELTLTPIIPTFTIGDAGACQPYFVEYLIQNNTLYDAPNTYFAATSTANTTVLTVTDGANVYSDPIISSDISPYAVNNIFVKLGTIKAGDKRIVRVYGSTNVCTDALKVYTNYGCAYPASMTPVPSPTLDSSNYSFTSQTPAILSHVMADLNVMNLCDNKTIEIEIRNAKFSNIYKMLAGFKLPFGAQYVANTAQIKYTATTGTYTAIPVANVTMPIADSLVLDLKDNAPFNTACGLTGADTSVLNVLRIRFDIAFVACPLTSLSQLPYKVSGENFCGVTSSTRGNVRINFIGMGGNKNHYEISPDSKSLDMCAAKNQVQTYNDTIFIKNIGGFGTFSGLSSGLDSMTSAMPFDTSELTLSNLTINPPFNNPVFGTNAVGQTTFRVLIPANIPVGGTIALTMSYSITPKRDSICLTGNDPHICFFSSFSAPVLLDCPAKSLSCNSVSSAPVGTGLSVRGFKCCFGSIGNYVFMDNDNSDTQTAGDMPLNMVRVYLLNAAGVRIDSTFTNNTGFYKFSNLFAGDYSIEVATPAGKSIVTANAGGDDTLDSDINASGKTGTYTIDVSKPLGDPARDIVSADAGFKCIPPTADAGTNQTICVGQSANLLASGGVSYLWSNGTATASTNVTPASTTTYLVTVTNSFGCTAVASVVVTVNPLPTSDAGADTEVCAGQNVNLTASGGVSYLWSTNETTATIAVAPSAITVYTVTVTDVNGCQSTDNVSVTPLSVNAGADVTLSCAGGVAPTTHNLGITGAWGILNQPSGANAQVNGNGDVSAMTLSGTYTIRLSVAGAVEICHDDVKIIVPNCTNACPPVICVPVSVVKN